MGRIRTQEQTEKWLEKRLLRRFLQYVRIDTTSDSSSGKRPTTAGQWKLGRRLLEELRRIGVKKADLDERCCLTAYLEPSAEAKGIPVIGFMAHLDTSEDAPGKGVKPVVHTDYDGKVIRLDSGLDLDPKEFPELRHHRGTTIITSDGNTLLGADDKAGIAEIMTALEYLIQHPEVPHGGIEIIFTSDEETGFSPIPVKRMKSRFCYTLDGGGEGIYETECFEAFKAELHFNGKAIHLGKARGKLVNAVELAAAFVNMLPKEESPQATDGRYGYYCPLEIKGHLEEAVLKVYLRDFEPAQGTRRLKALRTMAKTIEGLYPGSRIELKEQKQYSNMRRFLRGHPEVIRNLRLAIRQTGLTPIENIVRGGTDGARLSEMGIPTPNIFTGGYNYHSKMEWAALSSMVKASLTILNLTKIWAGGS
jgi:tripeptide aminopeptidase